jgi:uncharacterized protein
MVPRSAEARLEAIVRSTTWLMRALEAARRVDAPDWLIGAGAVRTAVWDRLHGYDHATPIADIDLAFFDATDLSEERERQVEACLRDALPNTPWDAKNQAAVHLWYLRKFGYAVEPLQSSADGVATWPETATAVALRLTEGDDLIVCAPFGLDDLLGLVHRRNPRRARMREYERADSAARGSPNGGRMSGSYRPGNADSRYRWHPLARRARPRGPGTGPAPR